MLRETEFAYAPNEALSCRRHPIFDSPAATADAGMDVAQPDDDTASTPTSITGIPTPLCMSVGLFSGLMGCVLHCQALCHSACLSLCIWVGVWLYLV